MGRKTLGLLVAATLTVTACGSDTGLERGFGDPDAPLLQVESQGGFAPVELILGVGPRYTLLADGRLIYEGPTIAIYPGPLIPNYQVTTINDDQMNSVLDLVDEIGLPGMDYEIDDSQAAMVADATTEVVTYWDSNGEHTYAVYALGIDPEPSNPSTAAFADLFEILGQLTGGEASTFEPDRVRVIAGPGNADPEFEDVRDWPLEDSDFTDWETLPNGWMCTTYGPDVLGEFMEASQATVWTHPDPTLDNPTFKLLVRPLHPGEPDCPEQ